MHRVISGTWRGKPCQQTRGVEGCGCNREYPSLRRVLSTAASILSESFPLHVVVLTLLLFLRLSNVLFSLRRLNGSKNHTRTPFAAQGSAHNGFPRACSTCVKMLLIDMWTLDEEIRYAYRYTALKSCRGEVVSIRLKYSCCHHSEVCDQWQSGDEQFYKICLPDESCDVCNDFRPKYFLEDFLKITIVKACCLHLKNTSAWVVFLCQRYSCVWFVGCVDTRFPGDGRCKLWPGYQKVHLQRDSRQSSKVRRRSYWTRWGVDSVVLWINVTFWPKSCCNIADSYSI